MPKKPTPTTTRARSLRHSQTKSEGWKLIRFSDEEVERDVETVARGIALQIGMAYEFKKRKGTGSGLENVDAPQKRKSK